MSNRCMLSIAALMPTLILTISGASFAGEHEHDHGHRHHDAHVHGIAALTLVLEGSEIAMEFISPAASIVGFEHTPGSESDHARLAAAIGTLQAGDRLFQFDQAADCRIEHAHVSSTLLDHAYDEHADHHEQGHEEHDNHADFEVTYHFECRQPTRLTQLTVELFDAFPAIEKLDVQFVLPHRQGAGTLSASNHVIRF